MNRCLQDHIYRTLMININEEECLDTACFKPYDGLQDVLRDHSGNASSTPSKDMVHIPACPGKVEAAKEESALRRPSSPPPAPGSLLLGPMPPNQ